MHDIIALFNYLKHEDFKDNDTSPIKSQLIRKIHMEDEFPKLS